MPQYPTVLQFYDAFRAAVESTDRTRRQTYRKLGEAYFADLRELTSGPISSAELAKMGHPYAKMGGVARGPSKDYLKSTGAKKAYGVAPLLPINRQSGALQRSIRLVHRGDRYGVEDSVFFDPSVAGNSLWAISPTGTSKVVARGLQVETDRRNRARLRAFDDVFTRIEDDAFSAKPSTRGFAVLDPL